MNCCADGCTRLATARVRWSHSKLLAFCGPCGLNAMNIATALGLQLELDPIPGVCRVCGCSDSTPCFSRPDGKVYRHREIDQLTDQQLDVVDMAPCAWIEPDLCSACVTPAVAPMLVDGHGNPLRGAP